MPATPGTTGPAGHSVPPTSMKTASAGAMVRRPAAGITPAFLARRPLPEKSVGSLRLSRNHVGVFGRRRFNRRVRRSSPPARWSRSRPPLPSSLPHSRIRGREGPVEWDLGWVPAAVSDRYSGADRELVVDAGGSCSPMSPRTVGARRTSGRAGNRALRSRPLCARVRRGPRSTPCSAARGRETTGASKEGAPNPPSRVRLL